MGRFVDIGQQLLHARVGYSQKPAYFLDGPPVADHG
jgi:hypothetical protein